VKFNFYPELSVEIVLFNIYLSSKTAKVVNLYLLITVSDDEGS
jgi:hypothetical protein